jgi:hypothetical protein
MKIRLIVPNEYREGGGTHDTNFLPIQSRIANICGGFTAYQATGGWKDDQGRLIVEPVTVFDCNVDATYRPESHLRPQEHFRQLAHSIAVELHQECVYVEFDGAAEFVKP